MYMGLVGLCKGLAVQASEAVTFPPHGSLSQLPKALKTRFLLSKGLQTLGLQVCK